MLLISKIQKGSELTGRPEDDIPAVSAMSAVGTATGNVLLPSEGDAAVSAVPGLDEYFDLIDKHRFTGWGQISNLSPPGLVDGVWRACRTGVSEAALTI